MPFKIVWSFTACYMKFAFIEKNLAFGFDNCDVRRQL